jgi:EAL and modified HD-GYP domain-containing signal transduction protein
MSGLAVKSIAGEANPTEPVSPAPPPVLVARQAIVDSQKTVIAYELLYRRSETAQRAEFIDGRQATLEVITSSVLEIGLDRLSADVPVHINYPEELLAATVTPPVPAQRVVIEVLENVRATPEIVAGLKAMRERGHQIALDDFSPRVSDMALLSLAHTVKIDISEHAEADLQKLIKALKSRRLQLVAERVETAADFDRCVALGFDAFQSYFLQHPLTFSARPVAANRLGTLRVVAILQNDDSSIADVERLIAQDVGLSYRVLRCINSSYYGFSRKVESIRQAIVILGFEKLRQLCALIALRGLDDRPSSVFMDAMARARMCESLGELRGVRDSASLFITGLFSTLDVLTGLPMSQLLSELPLSDAVTKALASNGGELGKILQEAVAYERGTWDPKLFPGLPAEKIQAVYLDSVTWAETAQRMVSD